MYVGFPTSQRLRGIPLPPREVARWRGLAVPFRCALFLLIPHVWIGFFLVWMCVTTCALVLDGQGRDATVTHREDVRSKQEGDSCQIDYVYSDEGGRHAESCSLDSRAYGAYAPGTKLPIRSIRILGRSQSVLANASAGDLIWGVALPALFWNGIMFAFFYAMCLSPLRQRRLLRDGQAVMGQITGKKVRKGKSTGYELTYIYPRPDGYAQTRTMEVRKGDYDLANAGDEVLVFYNPSRPKRSVIYEYCQYWLPEMCV